MKCNKQLKYSNYMALNHFHRVSVNNSGLKYDNANINVVHPVSIIQYKDQNVKVILMSYQYVDMWKQLYSYGVDENNIIFGIMFPPFDESEKEIFTNGRYLSIEGKNIIYHYEKNKNIVIKNHKQLNSIAKFLLRKKYRENDLFINAISQMETKPVSRKFGLERGTSIDRYYIEKFLKENKKFIYGDCLEIAENTYTLKYGGKRVNNADILHVKGWGDHVIKGNLETGEGIENDRYDCVIITQTLMFMFDIKCAAENIYKMLKVGGSALITVSGISQISRYDAELWGSFYGFHEDLIRALFGPLFGVDNINVKTYGNVKTAIAMLYGLCQEDLKKSDFEVIDIDYPVIIAAVLEKKY